jgi:prolyl-tRNA synthetase
MRVSQLLATTRKELSNTYGIKSQDLLVQAGYIRPLAAGIFSSMHFAHRTFQKIEQILREEMNRIGGVEITMPVVHPADLWRKTGRYYDIDESLVRFEDRGGRDLVLAMTHEEVVASIAYSDLKTYRQFPKLVYQIQTKFRDEARSRGGLIRVREFVMKDSYSLDTNWEGLQKQYDAHYEAYHRIYQRAGLPVISIQSDVGMMGGKVAHEYMYITEMGEDTIFICENTGYKANREIASMKKPVPTEEPLQPLQKVHTPGTKTIEDVANFLGVEASRCGKVVFFSGMVNGGEKVIMAIVRGDMEVNQNKLQNLVKSKYLIPATEEEIEKIGSVPGYATPIGIDRTDVILVIDDLAAASPNLVLGANELNHHMQNVCYGRDYEADHVGDIVNAFEGALAPDAKTEQDVLRAFRGVEVGNIFQLGSKYTDGLEALYMDENGRRQSIIMGSYGIGVGRLLGCLAEEYHDENGLKLPIQVAPYEVMIVALLDNEEVINAAEKVYQVLLDTGVEVLFDDRHKKVARAGEKFADADLIGIPLRVTISSRSLKNGGVEIKLRTESSGEVYPIEETLDVVQNRIAQLKEKS